MINTFHNLNHLHMMNLDPSLPYINTNGIADERTVNDSTNVESSVNQIK